MAPPAWGVRCWPGCTSTTTPCWAVCVSRHLPLRLPVPRLRWACSISGANAARAAENRASDRFGHAAAPAAQQIFLCAPVEHVIDIDHGRVGISETGGEAAIELVRSEERRVGKG